MIPGGNWQHVLATYDGSSKAVGIKLYLNGKPLSMQVEKDSLANSVNTSAPLLIGRRQTGLQFKGWLDDLRLYTRALAPDEATHLAMRPIFQLASAGRDKQSDEQKKQLA